MEQLIAYLLVLFILFIAVKKALQTLNINIFGIKDKDFSSFIISILRNVFKFFAKVFGYFLSTIAIFFEKLFDLPSNVEKVHEGFLPWYERLSLLNRFHKGLLLDGSSSRLTAENSFMHSVIVANTGRGKTSSFVIPNIFTLDDCTILATDLSGELFLKTSGKMKEKGFEIKTINFAEFNKSSYFNPLESVKTDKDILEVVDVLFMSANMNGTSNDVFWNNQAKLIIRVIISCLIRQRENEGIRTFCNFANVRFLLNNFGKNGENLLPFISKYADSMTFADFKGFITGNERTTQGFIATALSVLSIFSVQSIANLTSKNDINFEEISTKKTIIYLIIPQHELNSYAFLLSLFYLRFFKFCFESKNKLPTYCLLDEAGHIKIPNLSTIITTIRKYKVSISLIFQNLAQLESLYGKNDANVILGGGVVSKIFFFWV